MPSTDLLIDAPAFAVSLILILFGACWLYLLSRTGDLNTFLAYLILVKRRRRNFFTAVGVMVASFSFAIALEMLLQFGLLGDGYDVVAAVFFAVAAASFIGALSTGVRWQRATELENREMLTATAHFVSLARIDLRDPLAPDLFNRTP